MVRPSCGTRDRGELLETFCCQEHSYPPETAPTLFSQHSFDELLHSSASFVEVPCSSALPPIAHRGRVFFLPALEDNRSPLASTAFVEALCPVDRVNKESLVALFEVADEHSCRNFVVCVEKSRSDLHAILQSYLTLGFRLVSPKVLELANFVLLEKEL